MITVDKRYTKGSLSAGKKRITKNVFENVIYENFVEYVGGWCSNNSE